MGVDGCKGGWCAACLDDGKCDVVVFRSFNDLWGAHSDAALVLVDIPIGLPSKKTPFRMADSLARKILGRRHACVFSPGVREVHDCHTYTQACEINRQLIDKKISLQYWGLSRRSGKSIDSCCQTLLLWDRSEKHTRRSVLKRRRQYRSNTAKRRLMAYVNAQYY